VHHVQTDHNRVGEERTAVDNVHRQIGETGQRSSKMDGASAAHQVASHRQSGAEAEQVRHMPNGADRAVRHSAVDVVLRRHQEIATSAQL